MKVKFKKTREGAMLPKKATAGSAAYDLYVPQDTVINKCSRKVVRLGFAMEMPKRVEALIDARSGFSSKGMEGHELIHLHMGQEDPVYVGDAIMMETDRFDCDVIQGKIDSDYRGEVGVIVNNRDSRSFEIKAGTRIAQMTFHKVEEAEWEEVEELSETDREGGFGSTGK